MKRGDIGTLAERRGFDEVALEQHVLAERRIGVAGGNDEGRAGGAVNGTLATMVGGQRQRSRHRPPDPVGDHRLAVDRIVRRRERAKPGQVEQPRPVCVRDEAAQSSRAGRHGPNRHGCDRHQLPRQRGQGRVDLAARQRARDVAACVERHVRIGQDATPRLQQRIGMPRVQRQRQAAVVVQAREIEMRVGVVGTAPRRCPVGLLHRKLAKAALGDEVHDSPCRWIAILKRDGLWKHLHLLDRFGR
jgi:hypothetical protein